jgi:hypothetical protein
LKVKIIQKVFRQKWIFIESIPDGEQGVQGLAGEGLRGSLVRAVARWQHLKLLTRTRRILIIPSNPLPCRWRSFQLGGSGVDFMKQFRLMFTD